MAALNQWVNGGSLSALNWREVQHGFSDLVGKRRIYGCFEQAVNRREHHCSDLAAQRLNSGSMATLNWWINGSTLAALNRQVNDRSISIAALNRLLNMVTQQQNS